MFPANRPRPRLRAGLSSHRPLEKRGGSAHTTLPELSPQPPKLSSEKEIQQKKLERTYFSVLYTKRSNKKNKSWLDGYVILTNDRQVQLQNEDGKTISSRQFSSGLGGLKNGNTLEISSWELEVQDEVCEDDYISGRVFAPPTRITNVGRVPNQKPFKPLQTRSEKTTGPKDKPVLPLHNPNAEGAVILLPTLVKDQIATVPIVLDPFLQKRMRPHQIDGVRFLFDCLAGQAIKTGEGGEGAILADEMGLGKSLQAIALLWTLLKQGPYGKPLAKKAIIICPASLVRNWVNEIRKWLGDERLRPLSLESGASTYDFQAALTAYVNGDLRRVIILSYESFRSNANHIYEAQCGLMICDEGHRLKSSGGNKTIDALRKLPCRRRLILTGTPVQNDLEEFFAVCDFVNPGCFGTLISFRNVFATPIIASRDSKAHSDVRELGSSRAKELSRITSGFVIRRTSRLLEEYLPPKYETAMFCRLQPKQEQEYKQEARQGYTDIMGRGGTAAALCAINYLRKICSHPKLTSELDKDHDHNHVQYRKSSESDLQFKSIKIADSVKLQVAESLCEACLAIQDRIVIVSNFTTVLSLVGEMLRRKNISFCRLDGSTAVSQRGDIVRQFNNGTSGDVFLLSAKAGGVGLNLIGANRLILFDPDWNPATDVQAMARIWRDGQKKSVFVYRLLCTGTIEEKIYQRQLFKHELQNAVDGDLNTNSSTVQCEFNGNFTAEELKGIFDYNGAVKYCDTLDVLERSTENAKKLGLYQQFKQYRDSIREERVNHAVLCEDDDALNVALNGNVNTHGMVSYLYTKTYGTLDTDEVLGLPGKRKWSLVTQSEKESKCTSSFDDDHNLRKQRIRSSPKKSEEKRISSEPTTEGQNLTWEEVLKDLDYNDGG